MKIDKRRRFYIQLRAFGLLTGKYRVSVDDWYRPKQYYHFQHKKPIVPDFREEPSLSTLQLFVTKARFEYSGRHDEKRNPIYEFVGMD